MNKYLSDIDNMVDGTFGIEWEYEDGHRYWERFKTVEDRQKALNAYDNEVLELNNTDDIDPDELLDDFTEYDY